MSKESIPLSKDVRIGSGFQRYLTPTVLLGLILLLGVALRFYDLGTESYWIDEMGTVVEVQQSIPQILASGRLDQPPAYYLPFHFWVNIFGTSEVSTRSFSALTGIGSIVLIYLIGRDLFGKSVGLLSAFLMAVTEIQIYYSQISRFYSFFEFMALFSFLFFIMVLRSKKIIFFFLYGLASIIMVYGHTYGLFILIAQNLFFLIHAIKSRKAIATWLICQALIGLALLPYLFPLLFRAGGIRGAVYLNIGGNSTPSILDLIRSVYHFVFSPRRERSWQIILYNYIAAGALLVAGTWVHAIQQGKSKFLSTAREWVTALQEVPALTSKILLVSCWLLCPIVLPFVATLVIAPMYAEHYLISAAPALYLLLAFGVFSIRKMVPLIVSLGVLAIMIGPSLYNYYVTNTSEEWREVAAYINENSGSGDVIVIAPNTGIGTQQKTFNWYYWGTLQSCGLDDPIPDSVVWKELKQCVSGHERFWVIIRGNKNELEYKRYTSFFLNPNQTVMHLIKEQQFVAISVYLFELVK
jgi:uncharacterized membrane protein